MIAYRNKDIDEIRQTLEKAVSAICPRWLADQREDLVQIAMLKLLAAERKSPEQNRALSRSYLWKVAYSATADEIRSRRRTATSMEAEALEQRNEPAPESPFRDRQLHELGLAVRSCLLQAAEARRTVVQFHLQGHDLAEIERLTRWGAKRVRNLLYRGMADLRTCLSGKGYEP